MDAIQALAKTRKLPPQSTVEIVEGLKLRRTAAGIAVVRIEHTVDPSRRSKEWLAKTRGEYSSNAAFRREIMIEDEAGGGELVVADVLVTHWKKIVITDPAWKPDSRWRCEGGFDHGKVSPTALLRAYFDHDETIYLCGEYYVPGLEIWQHAQRLRAMADIGKIRDCYADPSIFPEVMQQLQKPGEAAQRAKSINELYLDAGIELFSPFRGDRSDVSYAARLMMHWRDLEHREPTLRIVCRNYTERPQPGLHNWDCPNLLWEFMRWRRAKSTAMQLMNHNPTEAIVDKDNHSIDVSKYICMSYPEPTLKTPQELAAEAAQPLVEQGDLTSALIHYNRELARQGGGTRTRTGTRRR